MNRGREDEGGREGGIERAVDVHLNIFFYSGSLTLGLGVLHVFC